MNKTLKQDMRDSEIWEVIKKDYHIVKLLGQGSYGKVMKCIGKKDDKEYAIKLMTNVFEDIHHLKQLVREIHIMRKLSKNPNNIYTTKLHDVIVTNGLDEDKKDVKEGLFLVMDFVESDIKKVLESV